MTYVEAIQYLCSLQMFGMKPGLDSTDWLAAECGRPQERLRFIHVAGTNGKGSVCAMLESIYREAGWKIGLFTSPHLVSFTERIQINRQPIPEGDVARWVEVIRGKTKAANAPDLTFFEVVTVLALLYFAEQRCELVIWEAGLGGRLDATNIVTPLASVITNIELDHEQWLGTTHHQIAQEKAGIIKSGIPVITAAAPARGLEVITATARERGSPLTIVGNEPAEVKQRLTDSHVPALAGPHQRVNAAVARAVVDVLAASWPVPDRAVQAGLKKVSWPGRLQLIQNGPNQKILLDGAHNPAGVVALRDAFLSAFGNVRATLILGTLADKDWTSMAQTLVPLASRILAVPVSSPRALEASKLAATCRAVARDLPAEVHPTLAAALSACVTDELIVITGSLYLVGEAMEHLGLMPGLPGGERALNDWKGMTA